MSQKNSTYPLVSIITVNYNNTAVTEDLLHSINRNSYPNLQTIVVDNASVEDPTAALLAIMPGVMVIKSDKNLGFAGGNNLGLKVATGDFLFLVNNDTEFTDGLVEGLLTVFAAHPDAGMVSPKFHYFFDKGTIEYAGYKKVDTLTGRNSMIGCKETDNGQYDTAAAVPTNYVHGGGMMVSAEALHKVGLMPEVYFLYYEEFDWCEQFKREGYQIYFFSGSLIYHKESMTTGKNSPLKTYYLTRNRILFMRRNVKGYQQLVFLGYLLLFTIPKNTLTFLVKREKQHLVAFWKGISWNLKHLNLNSSSCAV